MTHALPPPAARVNLARWLLPGNIVRVTWRPNNPHGYSRFTATVRDVTADQSCVRFVQHHGKVERVVAMDRVMGVEVITEGPAATDLRAQAVRCMNRASLGVALGAMDRVRADLLEAEQLLPGILPRLLKDTT